MKIKFKVHHKNGLHYQEDFSLNKLGLEHFPINAIDKNNKELRDYIRPLLINWTLKHYNYDDALPSWEVVDDFIYQIKANQFTGGEPKSIGFYFKNRENADERCAELNKMLPMYFVEEIRLMD